MYRLLFFTIEVLLISICIVFSAESKRVELRILFGLICSILGVTLGSVIVATSPQPQAIDVYRGTTELHITPEKNGVLDSVVVFKDTKEYHL